MKPPSKCLHDSRRAVSRGLCRACFNSLRILIKRGDTTDEQAVARGLCLPLAQGKGGGRPRKVAPIAKHFFSPAAFQAFTERRLNPVTKLPVSTSPF